MTRSTLAFSAAMVFGAMAVTASAQQWGPSAQSKYYHNPSNPPTYMAYNTAAPRTATQQQPAAAAHVNAPQAAPTHRRASTSTTAPATHHLTHVSLAR